jgi:hypothetical protein
LPLASRSLLPAHHRRVASTLGVMNRWLVAGTAVLLGLAACSGNSDDASGNGGGTSGPSSGGRSSGPQTAEVGGARLRFVNLFQEEGKGVPIDVWWGTESEALAEPVLTLGFGEASDYVVPLKVADPAGPPLEDAEVSVVYTRSGEPPSRWVVAEQEPLREGDQVTFLVGRAEQPMSTDRPGFSNAFYEASTWTSSAAGPEAGTVRVLTNNAGVVFSEGSDGDAAISQLGLADGGGCLFQEPGDDATVSQWGTLVDPGSAVADFGATGTCDGEPASDPFTTGEGGTRVVVYPYNDGSTRRLLVLDIPG